MSKITRTLLSILQENAGDNDITTVEGISAVASSVLFPEDGLALIDENYQDRLVVGFTLHYLKDEIGMETLPLWKLALLEKLFNNYDYINEIYANLDKQIFSDYRVRNVSNNGTATGSKIGTGSTGTIKSGTTTDTGDVTRNYEEENTDSKESILGDVEKITLDKKGSELKQHSGNDTLKKQGAEVQRRGGNDTVTDGGYVDNIASKGTSNYTNGVNITFDTPVDNLDDLRTPGGEVSYSPTDTVQFGEDEGRDMTVYLDGDEENTHGRGWDYMANQTYDYMAGAVEQDQTQTAVENSNDKTLNHNESKTDYASKTATVYGEDETGDTNERKDTTTYASDETITYGKTKSGDDPRQDITDVKKDATTTDTSSGAKLGTDHTVSGNTNTVSAEEEATNSNSEETNNSHNDTTDEIDYNVSMELVLKSESFLSRLWNLFDDLFINFSY